MYRLRLQTLRPVLLAAALAGCDGGGGTGVPPEPPCLVPPSLLVDSTAPDAIPALTNPLLTPLDAADYLTDRDLVLGVRHDGGWIALPHAILRHHEVVNLDGAVPLAVTFCPLTGSGIAFDRAALGGAELGVSGLLLLNNNVMFERRLEPSLWSQMRGDAICGRDRGTALRRVPVLEMTWAGWKSRFPDARVLSEATGHARNYREDPLETYRRPDNPSLLHPMPVALDVRRPPKERVLGFPDGAGGLAVPLGALDDGAPARVVQVEVGGQPVVIFYHRAHRAAAAFWLGSAPAGSTFHADEEHFVDAPTQSRWTLDGEAVGGPLTGTRLTPVADAYVAFWFAWAAFQPDTALWSGEEGTPPAGNPAAPQRVD